MRPPVTGGLVVRLSEGAVPLQTRVAPRRLILTAACLLLGAAVGMAQDGVVLERTVPHDGVLRSYLLYVPGAYDGTKAWALVINYHGFQANASSEMWLCQMNAVADTSQILVAYPQGQEVYYPYPDLSGQGWNILGGTLSDSDDAGFSLALIDDVSRDYRIDPARIHVTGCSMGASMAYEMACRHGDRVASFAAVANQMDDSMLAGCSPGRPVAFLQVHGTADPLVPFAGAQAGGVAFSPAPFTAAFWAALGGCSPDPEVVELDDLEPDDQSTVTRFDYRGCTPGTDVSFYQVNGGGHAWPGGSPLPSSLGPVNHDVDATAQILRFFRQHPAVQPPTAVGAEEAAPAPGAIALGQNSPNPFNGQTAIQFVLPVPCDVEMAVYDLTGQRVATLAHGQRAAGRYRLYWDGRDELGRPLASSVYLYRLRAGDQQEARRLLLVR